MSVVFSFNVYSISIESEIILLLNYFIYNYECQCDYLYRIQEGNIYLYFIIIQIYLFFNLLVLKFIELI